jgi:NADPH-dependent glutamate synthase beta subunit-like oxidoreductase/formate hydrogenlyase subunit 6/NADH:ubiquinone oxidoreductase subunit I
MKIIIDGKEIEAREGASILDAALEAGVFIPHLCSHPDLEAKGGCRLCSVEIDGVEGAVPACATVAEDGMKITVNGPEAEKVRRMSMELILATHPADCTGCPKYGKCELQSMYQYMGVSPERWRKKSRAVPNDDSNPLISHLFTRCVRCGRCIRACQDLRGVKVLDYIKTDVGIRAGVPEGKSLADAGCRFCGACIEVCPTGSIVDVVDIMKPERSYEDNIVPCRATCPAHIDIPAYIRYIKEGDFDKATAVIREKVPFPETLGSVCTHTCEGECKRGFVNEPVSICKLKRAAATGESGEWKNHVRKDAPTGKKAAVIGAGPSGLTAAYYLAKKGHEVTVFEKNEKAGGQCRYGIPAYRLPDEMLDREIDAMLEAGFTLKTGTPCTDPAGLLAEGFDAVLVSIGTDLGTKLPIEGNDLEGVYVNADFLKAAREGKPLPLGEKVMVLGGGNVAYDCARTAVRLGAKEVHIACLENLEQMTSDEEERQQGAEEGIILHEAHSFLRITGDTKPTGVEIQKVNKFYFDENRKAVIELEEGSNQIIEVDNVIFAVGQKPQCTENMGLELTHGPYIVAKDSATSMEGVFASGDVVTGTKSVIEAIAGGRNAASAIDKFLGGDGDISEVLVEREAPSQYIGHIDGFAGLERAEAEVMVAEQRRAGFDAIEKPFTCDQAKCEAERCLQCDLRTTLSKVKLWNEY